MRDDPSEHASRVRERWVTIPIPMAPMSEEGARRVLMIAYFFPPLGGAGVQRSLKFAKYLPQFGWRTTVLTTRSRSYPVADPTLADELPADTRVLRAWQPRGTTVPAMALAKLGLKRASRLTVFPDTEVAWIPHALRVATRAVRAERPAAIFSTSAPFSSHLVALALHRRTGIPWVADFRDEWSANPYLREEPAVVLRMAQRLERAISSGAAALTVVESYFDILNPAGTPVTVIPNGVDEDDLHGAPAPSGSDGRFTLSFVGTLYGERNLVPVLEALQRLGERRAIELDQLRVRVVGNDWRAGNQRWPVPVEQTGYLPHGEALAEMRSASVLLHYEAPASLAPTGKVYEYLASGRPVLCVARPDGRAAALVRDAEAGPIVAPDDPVGIEEAILGLYERWRASGLSDQPSVREWVLARYERRKLAADLATVLEAVSSDSASVPRQCAGDDVMAQVGARSLG